MLFFHPLPGIMRAYLPYLNVHNLDSAFVFSPQLAHCVRKSLNLLRSFYEDSAYARGERGRFFNSPEIGGKQLLHVWGQIGFLFSLGFLHSQPIHIHPSCPRSVFHFRKIIHVKPALQEKKNVMLYL